MQAAVCPNRGIYAVFIRQFSPLIGLFVAQYAAASEDWEINLICMQ
jgi:hypothetical protein